MQRPLQLQNSVPTPFAELTPKTATPPISTPPSLVSPVEQPVNARAACDPCADVIGLQRRLSALGDRPAEIIDAAQSAPSAHQPRRGVASTYAADHVGRVERDRARDLPDRQRIASCSRLTYLRAEMQTLG